MSTIDAKTLTTQTGETFTIRCARPDDAAGLLAYIRAVAEGSRVFLMQPDEFPSSEEQERQWIQDHLDQPGKLALAAECAGDIFGCLSFENGPFRRQAHVGTFGISLREDWRGRGVGTAMIQTLLDWAAVHPLIEKIRLGAFSNNPRAIALYRRLGFVEEGRRVRDIKLGEAEYADEVLMCRFVKPITSP